MSGYPGQTAARVLVFMFERSLALTGHEHGVVLFRRTNQFVISCVSEKGFAFRLETCFVGKDVGINSSHCVPHYRNCNISTCRWLRYLCKGQFAVSTNTLFGPSYS